MSNGNGGWFCVEDFFARWCVLCVVFCGFWQLVFCFHFVVTFLVCKIEGSGRLLVVF